ncbi:LRP2-binding protein-like [Dendronephthya gigantea]|uniref:LRP2-binding protein-like n=1 Tax=Dendronephthya gigantea TaxID=151771 RepID=UPI00106A267E|nr:LRP2-binding protein-like [Dendronephthya gigantea]
METLSGGNEVNTKLNPKTLRAESLPKSSSSSIASEQGDQDGVLSDERLECLLLARTDHISRFQLGQFYFEREIYEKAFVEFDKLKERDVQALYQLGVMYYDGLGVREDGEKGFQMMESVCSSKKKQAEPLIPYAQYNIGRAYYEGKGVKQSDDNAEYYWLLAAKDGSSKGSIRAQSILGMFYSRLGEESYDISKSYHWHQEAAGNGNIESQGALGVMFEYGIGTQRDVQAAFECFKAASEKGNIYAQGNLAMHYYRQKLYNQAYEIAESVGRLEDVEKIAKATDCLILYVAKGIALGCFVYARCLYKGYGAEKSEEEAIHWFKRAYQFDPETVARFQDDMTYGYI